MALKAKHHAFGALYRVVRLMEDVVGVSYNDVLIESIQYEEGIGPYSPTLTPNLRKTKMVSY